MLKPNVLKLKGMTEDSLWGDPRRARELSLKEFISSPACFYGMSDDKLMKYYENQINELRIDIVPLKYLNKFLSKPPYLKNQSFLVKNNTSNKTVQFIDDETWKIIYRIIQNTHQNIMKLWIIFVLPNSIDNNLIITTIRGGVSQAIFKSYSINFVLGLLSIKLSTLKFIPLIVALFLKISY